LAGQCDYTHTLALDLASVVPSVAGPKRPQDRIELFKLKQQWHDLFVRKDGTGYGKSEGELDQRCPVSLALHHRTRQVTGGGAQDGLPGGRDRNTSTLTEIEMMTNRPTPDVVPSAPVQPPGEEIGHGDVAIAAITSCTNTSNPAVMLGAGLLAKKAHARGLRAPPWAKTSLAPGARVATDYLETTG